MGAGAQVGELALLIEGDVGVLGEIVDELYLIRLALLLHELDGLRPGQLEPLQGQLFLADLAHLGLDLLHDLRGEGEGGVQIVVEALFNGGADGQLHLGIETFDCLRQDVGAGVPVSLAVLGFSKVYCLFSSAIKIPPCDWGRAEKRPTPDESSGVRRADTSHGSTLLARSAERDIWPLVTPVTGGPGPAY